MEVTKVIEQQKNIPWSTNYAGVSGEFGVVPARIAKELFCLQRDCEATIHKGIFTL